MKLKEAKRLCRVMADQRTSVRHLADKAGCSSSFIQQLRSGRRTSCTPALAARIARELSVATEYLFDVHVSNSVGDRVQKRPVA